MKSMFQYIAAVACVAALTACGGGAKTPTAVVVPQPAFKLTDTVVGTGTQPAAGDLVVINFTGYLYDSTKADFKGAKVESSVDTGKPATPFTVGVGSVITGWDQSILGVSPVAAMKVGGKRTAILPANLVYGAATRDVPNPNPYGYAAIPANSPMVYDLELVDVVKSTVPVNVPPPPTLLSVDTLVGTGATVAAGQTVTVNYALYLYDGTRADLRGPLVQTTIGAAAQDFVLADGKVITGWIQGVPGMKVGGKRTLTVPPGLGYGAVAQTNIPANSTLIFDIVLVGVK
ncbi:FKBP-type peptidyl-prolyl cis-trans isomerase [Rugamonas sp. A1-17]|nr:FKBP-type peptidyl-prolyl cis-trans isomerase [Rugamonas sp. A1-17]